METFTLVVWLFAADPGKPPKTEYKGLSEQTCEEMRNLLHKHRRDTESYCLSEGPRPRAVSYTHLRAHETLSDLVCRLLLEKNFFFFFFF